MFAPDTKILIVDDMPMMRKIIKKYLGQQGLQNITEANDGAVAWPLIEAAAAAGTPFQFICSDWNMPQMEGIELLKLVRGHPLMKSVPFLMITAEAEKGPLAEAFSSGVTSYIIKPFTAETFFEKLGNLFPAAAPKAE